jgi:hypothetical protein
MTRLLAVAAVAALISSAACKGKKGKVDPEQGKPVEGKHPTEVTRPDPEPAVKPTNEPPTMELPIYEVIGVGQEIGFGIEVIDEESDEIVIELTGKPESASWDPYTLTVVWKPTAADIPLGEFAAKVTEKRRDTGEVRTFTHHFAIEVTPRAQRLPVAPPLGAAVETLITIHDAERLAEVNKAWPLDAMLEAAAKSMLEDLPDDTKSGIEVADRQTQYQAFLHDLARGHGNPTLDPGSDKFDKALWGKPGDWTIIAVRPRLDKAGHELRIVYKAKAHAATYAMFRFRPLAHEKLPPEGVAENNKLMAQMVVDAFFTEDGKLDSALLRDKKAHGKKVAAFVTGVLDYQKEGQPAVTFLALPTEARLGGGNKRDAEGNYVSGDAWGWTVMKPKPKDGKMVVGNIPILGFVTDVAPSPDGESWVMKCGPAFDPESDAHDPRIAELCRPTGHTDLPATGDGYEQADPGQPVVSSLVDAANLFVGFKRGVMVATVPLEDPRRDLFEENGMSCHQCHVRKFGVRDYYDAAATDPSAGKPRALNKKQDTTYFVITPTERWQPYTIDFQHKQECEIKKAIKEALGLETSLVCPLRAE